MKKKTMIYLFILILITLLNPVPTRAEEDSGTTPTGFTYESIKPDNQRNNDVGYFDLRMTPNEKQTVQIKLKNLEAKEIEVSVKLNGAKTNANGVIEYGPTELEIDKSLKNDFEKIVKAPESVKIPANGETTVDIEINMPEASFDGIISGGIQLQQVEKEQKKEIKKTGVINKYAFVVGMLLSETDVEVLPDLAFNKVYPELNNYRNTIFINFSNFESANLENMTTQVQISKEGNNKVLYETKLSGMRMAPNSMINFPVSMDGDRMVAGNYRAKILVTSGDRKWEWDEKFKITDEDADKFNEQDVNFDNDTGLNWKLVIAIVVTVLLISLAIFFIVRTINKKKKINKK